MEVLGLWAAALVGLGAIYFSTRDAGEQVGTMREQLKAMSGQLDEMQQEGRAWLGPVSGNLANNSSPEEPLKISLAYRNFGKQPAAFVRIEPGRRSSQFDLAKRLSSFLGGKTPLCSTPVPFVRRSCLLPLFIPVTGTSLW